MEKTLVCTLLELCPGVKDITSEFIFWSNVSGHLPASSGDDLVEKMSSSGWHWNKLVN